MKLQQENVQEIGSVVQFAIDYLKAKGITLSEQRIGELGAYCLSIAQEFDQRPHGGADDGVKFATDMSPEIGVEFLATIFDLRDASHCVYHCQNPTKLSDISQPSKDAHDQNVASPL